MKILSSLVFVIGLTFGIGGVQTTPIPGAFANSYISGRGAEGLFSATQTSYFSQSTVGPWIANEPPHGSTVVSSIPFPSVTARAQAESNSYQFETQTAAELFYFLSDNGPTTDLQIPINYQGQYNILTSGSAQHCGLGNLSVTNQNSLQQVFGFGANCSGVNEAGMFSGQVKNDATTLLKVRLFSMVFVVNGGYGESFLDPFFFIDPAWAQDNPGYSLSFSEGIGNAPISDPGSDVPEPSTLLLFGLGLLAVARKRDRLTQG